ncbi:MAG: aldo/keto reductase [Neisseriaceae bacterium]|nr:aldo/keto reductase [Neisseriaceae bacterium]
MKTLNDGVLIPLLGYGTWDIRGKDGQAAIENALQVGFRHIDTASYYRNEDIVGNAVKNSGIKRSDIFITTKLMWGMNADYKSTIHEFSGSLKKLQLDYVDLYLIHAPYGNIPEIWRAMIELKKAGKIRSIGVSNFNIDQVKMLCQTEVKPSLNQIELNPFNQKKKMQSELQKLGVSCESYSPFGQGDKKILNNETLIKIGKKYHKTAAQVILRWQVQKNIITIPKTATPSRMVENFNIFDFSLSDSDIREIEQLG